MTKKTGASILYLNTIYDLGEKFRIMFIPDLGDDRKKQEVVQKTKSFYEVLLEEINAIYHFYENVRSDMQNRAVSVTEIIQESNITIKDIPGDTNLEKVEAVGKKIYQSLFPDQIKEYLKENPIDTIVFLSTNFSIPFELMHDGKDFLAKKYDIYRSPILEDTSEIIVSDKAKDQPGHIAIVTNPTNNLPAAERETTQITDFFKAEKELDLQIDLFARDGATYRALSKIFATPRLDIFHYSGHSGVSKDDVYFHLPDDPYSVTDLYLQYPALFFLNMCESDIAVSQRVAFEGAKILNFPMALMKRGAKACLATLWPILDASAAQFAVGFYKQMLNGEPFGAAIRKAKVDLVKSSDPNDITWLSFVLYGRPGFSTVSIPKKEPKAEEPAAPAPPKGVNVYFSYSKQDVQTFQLERLARSIDMLPQVEKVFYRGRSYFGSIVMYMNENIPKSDVLLVFSSKGASRNVAEEARAATLQGKQVIPIFTDRNDVPIMLRGKIGVRYDPKHAMNSEMQIRSKIMMVRPKAT